VAEDRIITAHSSITIITMGITGSDIVTVAIDLPRIVVVVTR